MLMSGGVAGGLRDEAGELVEKCSVKRQVVEPNWLEWVKLSVILW